MGGFQDKILNRKRDENPETLFNEIELSITNDTGDDGLSKNLKLFEIENIKGYPSCIDLRFPDGNCKAIPYSE